MKSIIEDIEIQLLASDAKQRLAWANQIIEQEIELTALYPILSKDDLTSMRCLWLLGDIADASPAYLYNYLEELYSVCNKLKRIETQASFAKFWARCGIPSKQEAMCIDLLFEWLTSPKSNVTTKSRALFALKKLIKKYPELTNELVIIIEDQRDNYSNDFKKRCDKILKELEAKPNDSYLEK